MRAKKPSKTAPPPFNLSLRIRHPSMDPADITRELALAPEHSFRAGEPRQSRSGLAPAALHAETYWLAALDPAAWLGDLSLIQPVVLAASQQPMQAAMRQNLGWVLSLFSARFGKAHGGLLRQIRSDGGQVTLLVALSADAVSGFSLAPEVSRVLGEFGIAIEFEMTND
jgi:hypothetical protein